jgi:hypothetical protein
MNKLAPRFSAFVGLTAVSLAVACGGNVVVDHGSSQGNGGAGASGGNHSTSTLSSMGGSTSDVTPVGPGPGPGVGTGVGGNTTTTATEVGPGPGPGPGVSASTGPQQCDCNLVCNDLVPCLMGQITQAECITACKSGQIPQDAQTCICNVGPDCGQLFQQCAMMGTGPGSGPGPGAIASVGVGPTGAGGGGTGGGVPMGCSDCANNSFNGACAMQAQDCEQHGSCTSLLNCEDNCGFDPMCDANCEMQHPTGVMRVQALLACAVCEECPMQCAGTELFSAACTLPP